MEISRLVKRSHFYSVVIALLLLQPSMGAYIEDGILPTHLCAITRGIIHYDNELTTWTDNEKRNPFNTFRDDSSVWSPQFSYTSLEWKRAQMNLGIRMVSELFLQ
ncbi:uncharacterized protein LOC111084892 [Limulus polyphemus]|uniref:Uncharacterized protein LOC111084892 n=1 Tax=Limulus polyphemus TaxID=6850 RepID=A0ABM1S0E2_LIMPO|nr:uncharacterized protein LOC111084892 [Limulus polyphemus]